MEITKINMVYFSATYTTKKILECVAEGIGKHPLQKYDITEDNIGEIFLNDNELLLVGVPVYAGRIPAIAASALSRIKGNNTPAIIVCVYGNRDYDDALLELKNITVTNGFKVISGGAFIAQHAIFPKIAHQRPNNADRAEAFAFGQKSFNKLNEINTISNLPTIDIKGNYPYKIANAIPLNPSASRKCNNCGTCAKVCPVDAIDGNNPRKTDKKICISCGRCIVVCPQDARSFRGLKYAIASRMFIKKFSQAKNNEFFI